MANVRINLTPEFLEKSIPNEMIPKRFAVATNIIMCADCVKGETGFLLFNYEPEKWNQWYPYFASTNGEFSFEGTTYGEIVESFNKKIVPQEIVKGRIQRASESFLDLLGLEGNVLLVDSPVEPEMWLKFSKTQNVWTFYYMEFLQVTQMPDFNYRLFDNNIVDFMLLDAETINSVIETGKFKGIDVVDNTIEILKNTTIISKLKEHVVHSL